MLVLQKNADFKTSRFHDGRCLCRIARGYGSEVQKESRIDHCSKLAKGSTIPNLEAFHLEDGSVAAYE